MTQTTQTTRPTITIGEWSYPLAFPHRPEGLTASPVLPDDAGELPAEYGVCLNCGGHDGDDRPAYHEDDMPYRCQFLGYWNGDRCGDLFHGLCAECGPCSHPECNWTD